MYVECNNESVRFWKGEEIWQKNSDMLVKITASIKDQTISVRSGRSQEVQCDNCDKWMREMSGHTGRISSPPESWNIQTLPMCVCQGGDDM